MKVSVLKRLMVVVSLVFSAPLMANELGDFSQEEFKLAQQGGDIVALAFHSSTCGTCRRQKPLLDALLKEDELKNVTAFRVDFTKERDLRRTFRVTSPSTIVVLKDGEEVTRSIGMTNKDQLRSLLLEGVAK